MASELGVVVVVCGGPDVVVVVRGGPDVVVVVCGGPDVVVVVCGGPDVVVVVCGGPDVVVVVPGVEPEHLRSSCIEVRMSAVWNPASRICSDRRRSQMSSCATGSICKIATCSSTSTTCEPATDG